MMLCNKSERMTAEAKVFVNNYRYEDRKLQNLNDQVGLCKQRIHVEITSLFTGTDGRFILVVVTLGRDNFQIFITTGLQISLPHQFFASLHSCWTSSIPAEHCDIE